ncbi:GPI ethanolamine phosphate transferase 2/3 subunit F [Entomortierella parvispora]|uniref:GPI ethanolamine phosphate transferase 2/3 subunit F n=1 Tax=Entomortierella parvispora TaxID=205924 RepID=A0A9P3HF66_9FUNG|nr:GPI ethanolamine phosphate transferase 2/3 subunit F [Entomortierella parvispora]
MEPTTIRSGSSSARLDAVAPTYPLLRMTLFAMANLSIAYATLTVIPSLVVNSNFPALAEDGGDLKDKGERNSSSNSGSTLHTLPSLSWTLVALFGLQTVLGLIQAHLHATSNNDRAAPRKSGQGKKKKNSGTAALSTSPSSALSSSLFGVLNTSISIGAVGSLICHVFAILFGAGIIHQAKETSQLACYLSLLTFYPASFILGTDLTSWLRVFIHNSPETYTEAALYCQGMMAIFGAWLGSIVIPLDWDRPWQAWPVPCVLGAFLFYMIGTVVGLIVSIVMRQRAARREFLGEDYQQQQPHKKKSQ